MLFVRMLERCDSERACMSFSADDLDATERRKNKGKPRPKGALPHLPDRNAGLRELRDWLTLAFNPPNGYRFEAYVRHGRKGMTSAMITLLAPAGNLVEFYIEEQRDLSTTSRLRAAVVSLTNGLCRMPHLSGSEASDVWVALCSLAHIADEYDERQETSDWLDSFLVVSEPVTGYTLEEPGRYDGLVKLRNQGLFERRHAILLATEIDESRWVRRPALLVDSETTRRYARVSELATYIRHVIGVPLGHGVLDSRIAGVGGERLYLESRNGQLHPHMHLYRLAAPERGA